MRLSIWVRDEVVKVGGRQDGLDLMKEDLVAAVQKVVVDSNAESESDDNSVSSEELELCDGILPGGDNAMTNNALTKECWNDDKRFSAEDPEQAGLPASSNASSPPLSLLGSLQQLFGHCDFREGQEWAVKRCLEKQRTLLVAPTGFGKSLCYALPAALMQGICIVVSPLISLMHVRIQMLMYSRYPVTGTHYLFCLAVFQDQLRQLPPRIPAATLSGTLSAATMASTVDDLIRSRLKILFVSPERLVSPSFRRLFQMKWNPKTNERERSFPTVSLLCVDEAHCMSQWGHNFRPSYLRLTSLLELIQPESVLAMTATAGPLVVKDICDALRIPCSDKSTKDLQSVSVEGIPDGIDISVLQGNGVNILTYNRDNINVCCKVMSNESERLSLVSLVELRGLCCWLSRFSLSFHVTASI